MRTVIALVTVIGFLLLAGCLQMTVTTEVTPDGELGEYTYELEMDGELYEMLTDQANESGYDSVDAHLAADFYDDIDDDNVSAIETSTAELDDGRYRVTLSAYDVNPDVIDDIAVTVDDDTVRFELLDPYEQEDDDDVEEIDDGETASELLGNELIEELADNISIEYVLIMPGEITDSNAQSVSDDGTTATWEYNLSHSDEFETFYAESSIDESGVLSDLAGTVGEEDATPGFTVGLSLAILTLVFSAVVIRGGQSEDDRTGD